MLNKPYEKKQLTQKQLLNRPKNKNPNNPQQIAKTFQKSPKTFHEPINKPNTPRKTTNKHKQHPHTHQNNKPTTDQKHNLYEENSKHKTDRPAES